MRKFLTTLLLCFLLLAPTFGCVKKRRANPAGANAATLAPPAAPAGMRLGAPYYSALGESCYEVLEQNHTPSRNRAICHRQEGWVLLPQIHTGLAGKR